MQMQNSVSESMNSVFDKTNNTLYMIFAGFILIMFTYGTGVKNNRFFFLLMKMVIVVLYLYIFKIIFGSLTNIYNINGLFISPSMTKLKWVFVLYSIFEMFVVILAAYVLYTVFF